MKIKHAILLAATALTGICQATVYTDATGEVAVGAFPHLDITSVEVTTDGTDITFRINLNGSPVTTDWGKYMIALRTGGAGTTTGNGWARPINFTPGMTRWVASWVDGGNGAQTWSYAGSWSNTGSPTITKDATGVTIVASAASLAIGPGETFSFDVYSSGGGSTDSAADALSASATSITNWGDTFTTNVVGGTPNPALTFTMPGAADFSTWIGEFGLPPGDQDPGDDPDGDSLTNQQEYDLELELNPNNPDTDGDFLDDNIETATGVYVNVTNTGTQPSVMDTDGDGVGDGDEVLLDGGNGFGFISNPNIRNYDSMAVPGSFTTPTWQVDGSADNSMDRVDETLTGQYQWTLHYNFRTPAAIEYKFAANLSWDNSWGNGGGNITANIRSTGFHTFTFDSSTQARTLTRRTYADAAAFLLAYGGLSSGTDTDGDSVNNEVEFLANTDPTEDDTDGDGTLDGADPDPLQASRNVVFTVNMSVQETLGNFIPAEGVVVKFFTGNMAGIPDLTLTEIGDTGVYTGTRSIPGLAADSSGGYKFFTSSAPNNGYETVNDRSFPLGAANATQTLDVVFFNNDPGGFSSWLSANAPGQTLADDHDGDGVDNGIEYFMGQSGTSFTPPPAISGRVVTWQKGGSYTGTYGIHYVVQTSANLIDWTNVGILDPALNNGSPLQYTLPENAGKIFVRLSVTGP